MRNGDWILPSVVIRLMENDLGIFRYHRYGLRHIENPQDVDEVGAVSM